MLDLLGTRWEDLWAGAEGPEALGAVYTRPAVVRLILDLAGYDPDGPGRLAAVRVLEPGCGDGAFISELVSRIIRSERRHSAGDVDWHESLLDGALRAVDVDQRALASARSVIVDRLEEGGCPPARAITLAERWTVHADFLLTDWPDRFDLVCGNPPYLRIEDVPKAALACYRDRFETLTDRADLYIAFIEQGLHLLSPAGRLAFICANRFAKNQYGAALRRLIAREFGVRYYLNLEHTQPFERDVSAYPAVLVVDRTRGAPTIAGTLANVQPDTLDAVRAELASNSGTGPALSRFPSWYPAGEPWVTTCEDERHELDRLFSRHPTLEKSAPATRIGIGVATGADGVFVIRGDTHGIEAECLLPLARVSDVSNQGVDWSGSYLVNPFAAVDDGSLADLASFPGFARYLEQHATKLRARHIAKARPQNWYRTIDRVWRGLQHQPKLLIPDIQASPTVAYDAGEFYPHHNLYWITSGGWNLRALQALLRSSLVYRQVKAHSVQMRGGSLRWQAQTLRRVRIPDFRGIRPALVAELARLSVSSDTSALDDVAAEAFGG